MTDELMRQAEAAYRSGNKQEARRLLDQIINQNERHERAWLLLSAVVDSLEDQQLCLENVLAINPANVPASKGLETVKQKIMARRGGKPADSPPAAASSKGSSGPIGAEFATASGDSLLGGQSIEDSFDDWLAASGQQSGTNADDNDQYEVPTSVDWGASDEPAFHGSGQQVDEPIEQFDAWIENLPLDASNNVDQDDDAPFSAGAAGMFGDTSHMIMDDAAIVDEMPGAEPASTFDDDLFDNTVSPWESASAVDEPFEPFGAGPSFEAPDESDDDDLFSDETVSDSPSAFGSPFSSSFDQLSVAESPFDNDQDDAGLLEDDSWIADRLGGGGAVTSPEPSSGFAFDFDDDDPASFAGLSASSSASAAPKTQRAGSQYYQYIPADIQAQAGGIDQQSILLLVGGVILVVLNLVSFGYLITSL